MSTVNKYLLPHRATKDVMKDASKSSMVLRKGELFVEAPSTGVGTGHSKIKIGDGKTIYSNLPYALGDTDNEVTNAIITFTSNTGTSAKDVINGVKSGQSLATQIAGLKQAITLIANTPFTNKAFSTISDGGNQSIAATGTGDILKVTAGDNVTLTMDNSVKSIKIAAKDTTYNNATTATSGLMSSGDKKRLDGISDGANKTAVEQKLFSGTNIGSVTIDGEKTELFAPTNTHYEAKNVVNNSSTSTSNTSTAVDNGNVTLNLVEDGKVRSSHKISGSGATKVTTDASGNIIVSSTDNNTTYGQASDTKVGLTKIYGIYGDNTDGSVTQQFFTGEMNKKLNSDGTAVKATQDSLGNNIAEYFKDASVNGQTVTFVRGNGTTFEIHTQDTNNKYYDFKGATTAANGGNGLVPAPSSAQTGYYLRGDGTWHSPSDVKVDKAGMADKASTATADSAGNNINTTYIKSVTGSNATVTVTKGNGATTSFTINNVSSATSAGSARSASTATADSSGQQINTTYVKGVTGAAAVVTVTKGDGTTTGFTVDGVKSASSATADSAGQNINTTYIKGVTGSNATVTVTKGNGATSAFIVNNVGNAGTATYAESASTATVDSAGQQINTTYIKSLSVSGRTITYTKGNGATGAITTQDNNTTYGAFKGATSSANGGSGLVPAPTTAQKDQYLKGDGTWASISNVISGTKVDNASTADYASSASSASTATADSAGQQINTTYIKGVTGSNATLTVTKGNGSTSAFTVNNVSNAAKASTATADSAGQQINTTYIKSITYSGHTVTVTKGNGFTSTFDTADNNTTYATGNETTSGLTKLYGSSGTSTDGTMTRAAITKLVNDTKTTLETAIGNINSFEIIVLADGETLPTTGANHTVYFVPDASGDADTKYAEYIWLTDYYEKIGMTTADLTNYYTKSETDNKISFATDSLVSSLSYSGHTLTITKKNGTTSSFNTTDNNTTYSAGTGLSLSGTTFSINAGASTVAHASSADSSTNDSAGNNINNTYIKNLSVNGRTITFTKGNGSTTAITTQDTNTTYDVFKGATSSANGGNGLVPAPTTAQKDMYLKGDGTWANISGVIVGTKVTSAANADSAGKATNDSAGQNINTTYIKSLSVSGRTITYTKGNGATGTITTQDTDTNTTYSAGTGLTLSGTTFSINAGASTVAYATNAGNGISNITRSGTTFTVTRQNGSTFSFNQQDTNTTYGVATSSADGLMSTSDKAKLDGIDPSAITTNAANIKKNADEIAELNSAVAEYRLMIDQDTSVLSALEKQIAKGYALKRNGRLFATKIWRFSNDSTSLGERLRGSIGLTCEPSTDTVAGQDDFATASPIFTYQRCNYIRDEDGTARVIALEGSPAYRTEGAYDVGNVYPTFYWNCEHHGTYDIYYMSDTPHPELGLVPWCEAVKADGTVLPIYTHSAFAAGKGSDGLLRSQPGLVPTRQSYNSMITEFQKKGTGYWGAGSERNLWGMLMLIIKYATKNVQKIFAGHTQTANMMEMIAYAETGTKRVLIANNNQGFFEGMCVSIGSAKNQDPNTTTSYDIVNRARVKSVSSVTIDSTTYVALDLDVENTFDTAETYCVKCYPSIAGETDRVIGHLDGSYLSNTDGRHPLRILGTEFMWGQVMVESNSMSEKDANGDWLQYFAPKGVKHVANAHTGYLCAGKIPGDSSDYWIGDIDVDTRGFMWPSTKGTSDSLGAGDRVCGPQNGSAGDLRERYTVGHLWRGSEAGFAAVNLRNGLSLALWSSGCCD